MVSLGLSAITYIHTYTKQHVQHYVLLLDFSWQTLPAPGFFFRVTDTKIPIHICIQCNLASCTRENVYIVGGLSSTFCFISSFDFFSGSGFAQIGSDEVPFVQRFPMTPSLSSISCRYGIQFCSTAVAVCTLQCWMLHYTYYTATFFKLNCVKKWCEWEKKFLSIAVLKKYFTRESRNPAWNSDFLVSFITYTSVP